MVFLGGWNDLELATPRHKTCNWCCKDAEGKETNRRRIITIVISNFNFLNYETLSVVEKIKFLEKYFTINFDSPSGSDSFNYDNLGNLVYSYNRNFWSDDGNNTHSASLKNFPSGVYHIVVTGNNSISRCSFNIAR
ncbi:hypothetical protein D9V86_00795 [Bacteroidetes/Chlorobi group bacterium ChocPot_Mid]|nr:MAG: hypothetical protein D9V86_00795 [Bacteroidetes/Chlorobi group bacterium ChocPot_Mid]